MYLVSRSNQQKEQCRETAGASESAGDFFKNRRPYFLAVCVASVLFAGLVQPVFARDGQIAGSEFRPQAAPGASVVRIDYVGGSSHGHELYIFDNAWFDYDLTAATGGPTVMIGTPVADAIDTIQNVTRVNYAGTDSHVHEFYLSNNGWHDFDLTAATGGPQVASGTFIANVVDTIQNVLRVDYVGGDSHVHEFYIAGNTWHDFDLTAATGGPQVASGTPIADIVDTTENVTRVHYIGADSHVHEFYIAGNAWHDFDLTAATGGPNIATDTSLTNVVDTIENVMRVHYVGDDSHVHEFYIAGNAWHDFDLTAATGGPKAAAPISLANVVDTTQGVLRVNYFGSDNHVHQFYIAGNAWHDFDLTMATNGPTIVAGASSIAGVVDTSQNVVRLNYVGFDADVHQFYIFNGAWQDFDVTLAAGGPQVFATDAIANIF